MLGGIDALIFTGSIGEHAAFIRAQVGQSLERIGVDLDAEKNATVKSDQEAVLSSSQSKVELWLIPTDEEAVIGRHTSEIVGNVEAAC